jgi:hypothetical protein
MEPSREWRSTREGAVCGLLLFRPRHPAIASRMFARNRLQFEYAESGEKEAFWGLNRHFLGLKRGKIGGSQLLIRQQGKNASCLSRASYEPWTDRKMISTG